MLPLAVNEKDSPGKKLLILVNDLSFFLTHRLAIAKVAISQGYDVIVGYGELGRITRDTLRELEFKIFYVPMRRGGTNLLQELRSFVSICYFFFKLKPDLVHLITIKPFLYGGLAARLMGIKSVVSAVPGLGHFFSRGNLRNRVLRALLFPLYRLAFGHPNQCVIIQNLDDANFLVRWGVLNFHKTRLLRGSGVNLSEFTRLHEPEGIFTVCFAARLLRDKGVYDFVSAARLLRKRGFNARFWLAGNIDLSNPTGLTELDVKELREEGVVEVIGYQTDIPDLYSQSHIICLPSFYGEGLPKALIEAAAASRAVVTTDHPGCRDAIIPNVTGLLIPVKNYERLAEALQWLIEHPKERIAMGRAGRKLAEQEFAIQKIVSGHLDIYQELLDNISDFSE